MAKVITKKEVAKKATDKSVETKMATGDGKLKVKKITKPSIKAMEFAIECLMKDKNKKQFFEIKRGTYGETK